MGKTRSSAAVQLPAEQVSRPVAVNQTPVVGSVPPVWESVGGATANTTWVAAADGSPMGRRSSTNVPGSSWRPTSDIT